MEGDTHIGLGENAASICKLSSLQSTVDADINSTQTTTVYCNRPSNLHRHRFSIFLSLVFGNCLFPAIVTMKSHSGPKHSHGLWLGPTTRSPPPSKRHPSWTCNRRRPQMGQYHINMSINTSVHVSKKTSPEKIYCFPTPTKLKRNWHRDLEADILFKKNPVTSNLTPLSQVGTMEVWNLTHFLHIFHRTKVTMNAAAAVEL